MLAKGVAEWSTRVNNAGGQWVLKSESAGRDVITAGFAGNVTIAAPSSGIALSVANLSNQPGIRVQGDLANNVGIQIENTNGAATGRASLGFTRTGGTAKEWYIGNDTTGGAANEFHIRDVTRSSIPFSISSLGNVAIGLPSSGYALRLPSQTPASASAPGIQGELGWDADYFYVCVSADTWKRTPLVSW
jgi:hypothetical protein